MNEPVSRCTCFCLRRAARRASQVYDRELAAVGLSVNEFSILRRAREPQALGALADLLGMDRTTLTRNLRPLLDAGWVEEHRSPGDARKKLVATSRSGRRLLDRAEPHWQRAEKRLGDAFGARQTAALRVDLERLSRVLRDGGEGI